MTSASRPAPTNGRRIPGEIGVWIIVFGDLFVFSLFFLIFAVYQKDQPALFAQARATLNQTFGLLNTLLLLTSSWWVGMAMADQTRRRSRTAKAKIGFAMLCGLCFVSLKILEYREKLQAGSKPTSNDFYMLYFCFTGIHLLHVTIGLGALFFVYRQLGRKEPSLHQGALVEGCTIFWHLVDVLWIILFALFYLKG